MTSAKVDSLRRKKYIPVTRTAFSHGWWLTLVSGRPEALNILENQRPPESLWRRRGVSRIRSVKTTCNGYAHGGRQRCDGKSQLHDPDLADPTDKIKRDLKSVQHYISL